MKCRQKEEDFTLTVMTPQSERVLNKKQFGRLTVIRFMGKNKIGIYYVECICSCGAKIFAPCTTFERGKSTSCGCYQRERSKAKAIHGDANWIGSKQKSKTYAAWQSIKDRCFYPNHSSYNRYGGVGTTMCEGYKSSYINFKADMGDAPNSEYSVDRKNAFGHYSCGKCKQCISMGWEMNIRWADKDTQNNNKKNTVYVDVDGVKMSVTLFEKKMGYNPQTIYMRLKSGWSDYDAVHTPINGRGKIKA